MNIIIMDNYNIHKLCYENNLKKVKNLLKKNKNLLFKKGINEEYPIHIACFIGSEKLIDLFLKYEKKILQLKNIKGETGYHILALHPKILVKKLDFIKTINFDINTPDNRGKTILITYLLLNTKLDINLLKKLKKLGASLNEPKNNSNLFRFLLKNCDLDNIVYKIFKIDSNNYNSLGLSPLHMMILNNNLSCVRSLLDNNFDIKDSGINGKNNVFEYGLRNGSNKMINLLLNYDIDYNYVNQFGDTYLHSIILSNIKSNRKNLINHFIKNTNDFNIQNIDGDTIIHLLSKNNELFEYIDLLKSKFIDISLLNKEGKSVIDYLSKNDKLIFFKIFLNNKNQEKQCIIDLVNNRSFDKSSNLNFQDCDEVINYLSVDKVDFTLFTSYTRDAFIYNIVMLKKYKNLKIIFCDKKKESFKKLLINSNKPKDKKHFEIYKKFYSGIRLLYENFNGLLCSEIYWHDTKLNFIHKSFYDSLGELINNDIIFFNISLVNLDVNHANIVIIDNILETIERFDPYGLMGFNSPKELDKILEKNINKVISKKKNKKYKYLSPNKFLNVNSFQSLSRHDELENKNIGDVGGFCLAWCYWYLENRLNNMGIKQEILVKKLNKKLINNDLTITEYIRSYANKLHLEKSKILSEFKITPSEYYKIYPGFDRLLNLYELIFNKIKSL